MADYTISISDNEKRALETVINPGTPGIRTWAEDTLKWRAHKAASQITQNLFKYCNDNNVQIAIGITAQIEQAYSVGIAVTAGSNNP
tara:strand:- start:43 stop:303 length:261 start_codon:yes stop_codon:yes gene_type:complete